MSMVAPGRWVALQTKSVSSGYAHRLQWFSWALVLLEAKAMAPHPNKDYE